MGANVQRHGPWAVVTGAARGLGATYTRQLRARGFGVVAVDRDEAVLDVATELDAVGLVIDLADADCAEQVRQGCGDREVGLLVNNAAVGAAGALATSETAMLEATIAVNTRAPLLLTRAFLPPMLERRRGGILLMSSMVALHGAPKFAAYAASRGFTLSLGESLWEELREQGIDVLAVCPGATDTPGLHSSNPDPEALRNTPVATAEDACREALDAIGEGPTRILGRVNRAASAVFGRLMPRALATRLIGANVRKLYPG